MPPLHDLPCRHHGQRSSAHHPATVAAEPSPHQSQCRNPHYVTAHSPYLVNTVGCPYTRRNSSGSLQTEIGKLCSTPPPIVTQSRHGLRWTIGITLKGGLAVPARARATHDHENAAIIRAGLTKLASRVDWQRTEAACHHSQRRTCALAVKPDCLPLGQVPSDSFREMIGTSRRFLWQ